MALTTVRHHQPLGMPLAGADSPEKALARKLLWVYFFLLLFEGALRKWFMAGLSTPLLVIRDPFLLGIIALAYNGNFFPDNKYVRRLFGFALAFCFASLFGSYFNVFTILYGIRTNCLHFLLIFIIPKLFSHRDVIAIGKWCFICAIPISYVVAIQFKAAPETSSTQPQEELALK